MNVSVCSKQSCEMDELVDRSLRPDSVDMVELMIGLMVGLMIVMIDELVALMSCVMKKDGKFRLELKAAFCRQGRW